MYYLRARFYNPVIGRFIQEDTYYGDGLNLYAYCHNNPVGYVDPSGHAGICEKKFNRYKEDGFKKEEAYVKAKRDYIAKIEGPEAAAVYFDSQYNKMKSRGYEFSDVWNEAYKYDAPNKKRNAYMGRTPSKKSITGQAVIERMRAEGKIRGTGDRMQFMDRDGNWHPIKDADMAHRTDAVAWWNQVGRYYGPRHQKVRKFMLDPNNYYLEYYSINRSDGAKLNKTYMDPVQY